MTRELVGPFLFGVGLFTMLGMSITYLFAFTDYAVKGIPLGRIVQISILLLPGMLSKTLPAAMLLASLLATGRMSGDSEVTALYSVGANLWTVIRAVAGCGLLISIFAILLTEYVVPRAAYRANVLKMDIVNQLEQSPDHPIQFVIKDGKKIQYMVMARNGDFAKRTFWGVSMVGFESTSPVPSTFYYAKEATYAGGDVIKMLDMRRMDLDWEGVNLNKTQAGDVNLPIGAGPSYLRALFATLETQAIKDPDVTNIAATRRKIDAMRETGANPESIRNLEMGLYNKIAFPLATFIFALVGAPLGIRQSRTSNALGFALALVIIFAYWMLSSYMAVLGTGGAIPAWLASFGPNVVGIMFAVALLIKRGK